MLHMYRGSLPYTNFITLIFQNFPNIQLMRYLASFISLLPEKGVASVQPLEDARQF